MRNALTGMMAVALAGCATVPSSSSASAPAPVPASADTASMALAVNLYHRVASEPGNIVVSPTSLAAAMAAVALGARGETRAAIDRALRFAPGDPTAAIGADLAALAGRHDGARVDIANALWVQQGFALKPDFIATAKRNLGAQVAGLDFARPQDAASRINRWASDNTAGRIPSVVDSTSFGPATRLVVTNAVYLLADWEQPFVGGATVDAPFTDRDGQPLTARMMSRRGSYRMIARDGVKAIELPYRGGRLAMVAILPDAVRGLPAAERRLDAKWLTMLTNALDASAPRSIKLALPKLQTEARYRLAKPLAEMGMGIAFTGAADFGGIADARLALSQVVQKTFLKIDEKGTEAAAVTVVEMIVTGIRVGREESFIADHPFLFVIRDRPTGQILFIGRIEAPVAR